MLFQETHIRAYEESDGEIGHEWLDGVYTLILTTIGRSSGEERKFAAVYRKVGEAYVLVASRGGSDSHPNWYLNLLARPRIRVQVGARQFTVRARTAEGAERAELWELMVEAFPKFAEYQSGTSRVLPVVVLDPVDAAEQGE
ncbi:nitroreductase family deazaflavin-dependent oxidoreductase [Kitasatospora sp. NBC_01287]|uniref:nitroreductase family deazaflavin-dependent oxidoreductase n=1 Tax=Kitasatospora sp. NBC_01287 TaxID=2903573 RepID=UPI00224E7978|nr:nitroreductase family deazaflavin-dependent oxidoreductase [Kitasatospora sp. NBC_01287]MCX4751667.1 nitroreductase family deazaflavin-dependent oxidoreductase [Kitasatospora sp. NBC_01287]